MRLVFWLINALLNGRARVKTPAEMAVRAPGKSALFREGRERGNVKRVAELPSRPPAPPPPRRRWRDRR